MTHGYRDLRLQRHNLVGQHQPAISSIYQLIRKKSQSPSAENQLAPLLNQGNWHLIAILWDACANKSSTGGGVSLHQHL